MGGKLPIYLKAHKAMKHFPHAEDYEELTYKSSRRKFWLVINLIWLLIIFIGAPIYWQTLATNMQRQSKQNAERYAESIHAHLQRFEAVPRIVSQLPYIKEALFPADEESLEEFNSKLFTLNSELRTDVIYVINQKGETLASSNYRDEDSFVGSNYSFRPYFQDAINGIEGRYHALGAESSKLGYYYSAPIYRWGIIVGVIVAKVNLEFAKELLHQGEENWLVTDHNNIVFLASDKNWLYKSIQPLSGSTRSEILNTKQYGSQTLETINTSLFEDTALNQNSDATTNSDEKTPASLCLRNFSGDPEGCDEYLFGVFTLPAEKWNVYSLYSRTSVFWRTVFALTIVSLAYWLVALVYAYLSNQYSHRRYLARVNDQLEDRLNFLTQDLRKANQELQSSVNHYRVAKEELERTQDELIQAEKLAVLGEVAVGLNHELNQPLLAIKAYSDNTREFLQRDNVSSAIENLSEINHVTETMAMIISRFRVFSRKDTSSTLVNVRSAIDGALVIFMPRARNQKIKVLQEFDLTEPAKVYCDQIQLQQVILNLLANAAQAIESLDKQIIEIKLEKSSDIVTISIADNGPGLEDVKSDQLFTPFYTTKPQGLGLGLSLSKRIIETFDGDISFGKSRFGGTEFRIVLPEYKGDS